ncbi:DegV family protein [uncultured Streptococcus sp.]|uniref:DegV family protein n=1 Tax=uncultured Streptococcus sp. TaxID=83427 RepID=UPI0027DEA7A2|nr:DegV family protein [uncultured Streptococcus sp.]
MKLAVITDTSAALSDELIAKDDLYILDIPIAIDGQTYVEGQNLTIDEFYDKMAASVELPKTSQPSLAALDDLLIRLKSEGYSHVIGLFLSSGISGFWSNIQFLVDEHQDLTIAFPDTKITSAPQGNLVRNALIWSEAGMDFETIVTKLQEQIDKITAFIMVDDLNHLVKGGRLSNGSALLGNLLSIKPILRFDEEGKIVVYEKIRTEKKAIKRLITILEEVTSDGRYEIAVIHSRAQEKADQFYNLLVESGYPEEDLTIVPFGGVIATHLGAGAVAFGITPRD